jgi:hypothetical protein
MDGGCKEHENRIAKAVNQSSERTPSRQCAPELQKQDFKTRIPGLNDITT